MNRWSLVVGIGVLLCAAALFAFAPRQESTPMASPSTLIDADDETAVGFVADDVDPTLSMIDDPSNSPAIDSASDPSAALWGSGDASLAPVAAEDVDSVALGIYAEKAYLDEQGRQMIDLLEQDYAYLSVIITNEEGRPVIGIEPEFRVTGTSELLSPAEVSTRGATDASGTLDFALIGGQMGLDRITVSYGSASVEVLVNVISLRAAGFPAPVEVDGVIPWSDLMSARIRYDNEAYSVDFPEPVAEKTGERVKLSGFMVPLDPDLKQSRFLLTSNPPSCFYHIPGGPAGAVEVLASAGIEASWNPIVVEGRFEILQTDQYGVIYRLHDARMLDP